MEMLPDLGAMNEQDLMVLLESLEACRAQSICPYSGQAFSDQHKRYVMIELDNTFRVGIGGFMKLRALRDKQPFVNLDEVVKAIEPFHHTLREARLEAEAQIAAEKEHLAAEQKRKDNLISVVRELATALGTMNAVDGLEMTSQAFDELLMNIGTKTKGITDEALLLYMEERKRVESEQTDATVAA